MQRLIVARSKKISFDKNIRDIIDAKELSDQQIAEIIIKSQLFNKLIRDKHLSSIDIFNKLISARLGNIVKIILKQILSSEAMSKKIKIYNLNEVGKNIIKYIKENLQDKDSDLYKEINIHLYNI